MLFLSPAIEAIATKGINLEVGYCDDDCVYEVKLYGHDTFIVARGEDFLGAFFAAIARWDEKRNAVPILQPLIS